MSHSTDCQFCLALQELLSRPLGPGYRKLQFACPECHSPVEAYVKSGQRPDSGPAGPQGPVDDGGSGAAD